MSAPHDLVVFGDYGNPDSHRLLALFTELRERHPATVRIAWRHFPRFEARRRGVIAGLRKRKRRRRGAASGRCIGSSCGYGMTIRPTCTRPSSPPGSTHRRSSRRSAAEPEASGSCKMS
jgi:hypothetical protein